MKTNDYVKYMTQELVKYMDQDKQVREHEKEEKKSEREPLLNRWFGMIPLSVSLLLAKKAHENQEESERKKSS